MSASYVFHKPPILEARACWTCRSMGQPLLPSTFAGELWFCIVIAIVGMLLLAMLVGNMQVRAAGQGLGFGVGIVVWSTGVGGLDLGSLRDCVFEMDVKSAHRNLSTERAGRHVWAEALKEAEWECS
jgi:hypothetical protein